MLWFALACAPHVPPGAPPDDCAACHPGQEAGWRGSPHALAHEGPVFARSWAEERAAWCLDCHPPAGVACDGCHGPERRACVDCHQFELPAEVSDSGQILRGSGLPAQTTVDEWRSSAFADQSCASCHDPHAPIDRPARLRAALHVELRRDGDRVVGALRAAGVGHALPTGDPFRRLQLSVCADLASERPIAAETLRRTLERAPDGAWRAASDTRIPPPRDGEPAERAIDLHAPSARSWRLDYHLADPRHEPDLGAHARFVVATGVLEPR